jgi:hypothetical protein
LLGVSFTVSESELLVNLRVCGRENVRFKSWRDEQRRRTGRLKNGNGAEETEYKKCSLIIKIRVEIENERPEPTTDCPSA